MKRRLALFSLALILILVPGISACSSGAPQPEPTYSSAITENLVFALATGDYAKYIQDMVPEMKAAVPEATFQATVAQVKPKIGDYVSKVYTRTEQTDKYTIVYYKAKFSQEPGDVLLKVVFQDVDSTMKVAGFWLDSPKLRAK